MGAYQVNLVENYTFAQGDVYGLRSGRFVRVLESPKATYLDGLAVALVCTRDMRFIAHGEMVLTKPFLIEYGYLAWRSDEWDQRVDRVAAEVEAVRVMRENRALAADQDVSRARQIDAEYAAKKIAEAQERTANRKLLQMAA